MGKWVRVFTGVETLELSEGGLSIPAARFLNCHQLVFLMDDRPILMIELSAHLPGLHFLTPQPEAVHSAACMS